MLLAELLEFAESIRPETLRPNIVELARQRVLDYLGVALAGTTSLESSQVRAWMRRSPNGSCTVLGERDGAHYREAAFANSVSGNALECDDTHDQAWFHPGTVVVPAALATAEHGGSTWGDVLAAVVAGYEVAVRTALAATSHRPQGFGPTGTCGTLGAAAAAASLLRLNNHGWRWAVGIAGSLAPISLQQFLFDDCSVKVLYTGHASATGVDAAYLSAAGLTGPISIVEGEHGFLKTVSQVEHHPEALTRNLGREFGIESVSTKFYPCCRHFHAGLDCALALRQTHLLASREIREVTIYAYPLAIKGHDDPKPPSRGAAQQSYPYMMAVALCQGNVKLAELTPMHLGDPDRLRLASLVRLIPVQEWADGPMRARVVIKLGGERVVEGEQTHPYGSPIRPATGEQLEAKFLELVSLASENGRLMLQRFQSLRMGDKVCLSGLLFGSAGQREEQHAKSEGSGAGGR